MKFLLRFALALQGYPYTLMSTLFVLKDSLVSGFCLSQFCFCPFLKGSECLSVMVGDCCQFSVVGVRQLADFSLFEFLLVFQLAHQSFLHLLHLLLKLLLLLLF